MKCVYVEILQVLGLKVHEILTENRMFTYPSGRKGFAKVLNTSLKMCKKNCDRPGFLFEKIIK